MKNYHQCRITVLLFCSLLLLSASLWGQGTYDKKDPHSYEHAYIPVTAYKTGADLFRDLFKADSQKVNVTFLENETFEVTSFDEIQIFKSRVASLDDTLEAFEIQYGLRYSGGRYIPVNIYKPLKMVVTHTAQDPVVITYGRAANNVDEFYILESKKFNILSQDSASAWIENYKNLIRIDEKNVGSFRRYKRGDTGDATGQIFGFKEIEHFFRTEDDIYLTSWANIDLRDGIPTFRHCIAIANGAYIGDLTKVHAADMGTMCPPNCLKMVFREGRNEGKSVYPKKNNNDPEKTGASKFEKPLTWILITLGCLLIGFIIGRLAKRK